MTPSEVAAHLAERGTWRYSRSSGPGGQRRDHTETRVELTVHRGDLEDLDERVADRVAAAFDLERRALRLTSQADRSRERNRQVVLERLEARVAGALAPGPPPRRPTAPGRGARERRLADKSRRAQVKAARRPPGDDA